MVTIKKARGKTVGKDHNIWFHDIEVFPNYFLVVFKNRDTGDYTIIEINDRDNGDLAIFLGSKPGLIGYNCLGYDGQIIEFIIRNPGSTTNQIKIFSDRVINERYTPYKKDQLSFNYLDEMEINNYGAYSAKSTSLKHLAFFFRVRSVGDTPVGFNDNVTESDKKDIVRYCIKDVDVTEMIYNKTLPLIELRQQLGAKEGLNLINLSEPNLAKAYFLNSISKRTGENIEDIKYRRTYRERILGKDLILPYIDFKTEEFKKIRQFYENVKLYPTISSKVNPTQKVIVLKQSVEYKTTIQGTEYDYKAGGLHGCYKRGIYESNKDYIIKDIDYQSFYPRLAIVNRFSPFHIDTDTYVDSLNEIFQNRLKYDKKTNFALNYAFKILSNLVFGCSSSEFQPFYDVEYTLKTTVNGMLTISMLIEELLSKIYDIKVLQANTDGITIMYPREDDHKVNSILAQNEEVTGLVLETSEYKKMVIYNVNSYMTVGMDGEIKQKNIFETQEIMDKNGWYHKDPSMNIRAIALNEYFVNNVPVENTVNNCNNIFEFLIGEKGKRTFKWLHNQVKDNGVIVSSVLSDRLVRYYVGGKSSISKMWLKDKSEEGESLPSGFTLLNASNPVTLAQTIMNAKIEEKDINRYPLLDKNYYIEECKKIINEIENP